VGARGYHKSHRRSGRCALAANDSGTGFSPVGGVGGSCLEYTFNTGGTCYVGVSGKRAGLTPALPFADGGFLVVEVA